MQGLVSGSLYNLTELADVSIRLVNSILIIHYNQIICCLLVRSYNILFLYMVLNGIFMGEKPTLYIFSVIPALYPLKVPAEERIPAAIAAPAIWDENTDSAYTLPTLSLTTAENDIYSKKWADIQTFLEENLMKFVVGERPMSEWEDFIAQLWALDLQTLVNTYQDALDRYYER